MQTKKKNHTSALALGLKRISLSTLTLLFASTSLLAKDLIFTTSPSGTAGATPASASLSGWTTLESGYFSSINYVTVNQSTPDETLEEFQIAAGGTGITQGDDTLRWEEYTILSTNNGGQRHAFRYDFGTNATSSFTLDSMEIDVTGVVGSGISLALVYQLDGATNHTFDLAPVTANGTFTITLSETLAFTSGSTPLETGANNKFLLAFGDPSTGSTGNAVIEEVRLYAIPEPSTYAAMIGMLTLGIVAIRRRR